MDAELEEARRAEPPWDPLRERRVLALVNDAREARGRRRRAARWVAGGGALAAAAAIAVAWIAGSRGAPAVPPLARAVKAAEPPVEGRVDRAADRAVGRLALVDGSLIELEADARVEVLAQTEREVRIAQHGGEARYVVSHRPERAFVVQAADVEVRVRGTRFIVRHLARAVEVEVEQGRVEVTRDGTASMLTAGETLRIRTGEEPAPRLDAPAPAARQAPSRAPRRAPPPAPSMESLLADADRARRAGRFDDAARALRTAAAAHRADPRLPTALFSLGRVERRRGRHAAAAEAFERAYTRDPHAVLAEDALAEAAVSWAAAGRADRARGAATRYLARFSDGEYVDRVRAVAGDASAEDRERATP